MNKDSLRKFNNAFPCIFRLNGAHGTRQSLIGLIEAVRDSIPDAKLLLDMPGNKIRTQHISQPISLKRGQEFHLLTYQINYNAFHSKIKIGDFLTACDGKIQLEVVSKNNKFVKFKTLTEGVLGNNKGLHLKGVSDDLPFLFEKDMELIEVALKQDINFLGLSFVRNSYDIQEVKNLLGSSKIQLMCKVEIMSAVNNLDSILQEVKNIIIDRGDLLAEVGIIELPHFQEYIIKKATHNKVNVYLATHFLKSMENNPVPLISEVMDLHNTFNKMINGIQLSEETAVGKYPEECLKVLSQMLNFVSKNSW